MAGRRLGVLKYKIFLANFTIFCFGNLKELIQQMLVVTSDLRYFDLVIVLMSPKLVIHNLVL